MKAFSLRISLEQNKLANEHWKKVLYVFRILSKDMYLTCSLYPGLSVIQIPAKFFKSWSIWQNEKDSVPAQSQSSPKGATLKSCSNNINADKRPTVEVETPWFWLSQKC